MDKKWDHVTDSLTKTKLRYLVPQMRLTRNFQYKESRRILLDDESSDEWSETSWLGVEYLSVIGDMKSTDIPTGWRKEIPLSTFITHTSYLIHYSISHTSSHWGVPSNKWMDFTFPSHWESLKQEVL